MNSFRMCVVCRQMKEKKQLYRVVRVNGEFFLDKNLNLQGRGAYICKTESCIAKAMKHRAFERSFSGKVGDGIYKALEDLMHDGE